MPHTHNEAMRNAAHNLFKAGLVMVSSWLLAAGMLFLLPGMTLLLPRG